MFLIFVPYIQGLLEWENDSTLHRFFTLFQLACDGLKNTMNGTLMTVADHVPLVFTLLSAGYILENIVNGEKHVSPLPVVGGNYPTANPQTFQEDF